MEPAPGFPAQQIMAQGLTCAALKLTADIDHPKLSVAFSVVTSRILRRQIRPCHTPPCRCLHQKLVSCGCFGAGELGPPAMPASLTSASRTAELEAEGREVDCSRRARALKAFSGAHAALRRGGSQKIRAVRSGRGRNRHSRARLCAGDVTACSTTDCASPYDAGRLRCAPRRGIDGSGTLSVNPEDR